MANKWTNEQLSAITQKGNNILVAAAAGSGKTTVLVERIIRKIKNFNFADRHIKNFPKKTAKFFNSPSLKACCAQAARWRDFFYARHIFCTYRREVCKVVIA